jgi:hypothetical protein
VIGIKYQEVDCGHKPWKQAGYGGGEGPPLLLGRLTAGCHAMRRAC